MIELVEALNYRCLHYVRQRLEPFQVLIGPNASGKTTFLDTVAFLGDLVRDGLTEAINERTRTFGDLIWQRQGSSFELALEARIPEDRKLRLQQKSTSVRYEVKIGADPKTGEVSILAEKVLLKRDEDENGDTTRELFPNEPTPPSTIVSSKGLKNSRTVVNKIPGGNDNFYSEVYGAKGKGWAPAFRFGPQRSALGNLPADESKFPVAVWLRELLVEGIQRLVLNSQLMKKPSPPGQGKRFRPDGSNLPWVIEDLKTGDFETFQRWLGHIRTALPEIRDVRTVEIQDDKYRYVVIEYSGGFNVPSWLVSDGTLRLLALTLPAYLPAFSGTYLVEEPENGIHPQAVETVFQSLSSVYGAQILVATHSPVFLSLASRQQLLCFSKTPSGAVDIVGGDEHPSLKDWQGEENLSVLFAVGLLS